MRRFNYRWLYFVLVLSLSFSDFSFASTVSYWGRYVTDHHSTPLLACKQYGSYMQVGNINPTYASCYNNTPPSGYVFNVSLFTATCPFGDNGTTCNSSCNAPSTLVNGQCVAPPDNPCAVKTGGSQKFTKSGTSGDGYGSVVGGFVVAPQSGCFGGCAVSTVDQKCTGRTSGQYTCRGNASFSGQACASSGSGSEIQDNTANDPKPDPQILLEDKPCVYSSSGDTQSCTSEKSNEKEGQYCGTVNGVKTCVDSKPTKDGISIQTTVKTETKPDGSKVITKTDVATKTNCTGAGQCSSTSTTTTTTTNTNSSGATTGTTGSCTGEACPDKNTNPDGDGDGFGDCTGTDCGDEAGEGGASDFYQPGDDTYSSVIEAFADSVSQIPVVAGVDNFLTFTPSGACPVYTVDTWVFSVRLDQWCTGSTIPWELIKAVILACCAFVAFRIAFT